LEDIHQQDIVDEESLPDNFFEDSNNSNDNFKDQLFESNEPGSIVSNKPKLLMSNESELSVLNEPESLISNEPEPSILDHSESS
ncbi:4904_t:CDS:1, partial [Dentiscutata heterogama]